MGWTLPKLLSAMGDERERRPSSRARATLRSRNTARTSNTQHHVRINVLAAAGNDSCTIDHRHGGQDSTHRHPGLFDGNLMLCPVGTEPNQRAVFRDMDIVERNQQSMVAEQCIVVRSKRPPSPFVSITIGHWQALSVTLSPGSAGSA